MSKVKNILFAEAKASLKKLLASLSAPLVTLTTNKLDDGREIAYDGKALEVGTVVNISDESGNNSVLPDGDYITEDGTKFTITEGAVSSVEAPSKEKSVSEPVAEKANPSKVKNFSNLKAKLSTLGVKFAEGDEATESVAEPTGSLEERVLALEIIVDGLVEYCFGWQKQAEATEEKTEKALEVYEQTFAKHKEALTKLSQVVEVIADQAGGEPAGEAVGFNKKPKETKTNLSKLNHDQISAISLALNK